MPPSPSDRADVASTRLSIAPVVTESRPIVIDPDWSFAAMTDTGAWAATEVGTNNEVRLSVPKLSLPTLSNGKAHVTAVGFQGLVNVSCPTPLLLAVIG